MQKEKYIKQRLAADRLLRTMKIAAFSVLAIGYFPFQAMAQIPEFQWAKGIGGTGFEEGKGAAVDAAGNMYITGQLGLSATGADFDPRPNDSVMLFSNGGNDIFLAKYDAGGNLAWAKSWGGGYSDIGYSVATDAAGYSYITGFHDGTVNGLVQAASSQQDAFFAKIDPNGNVVWGKSVGGVNFGDQAWGIAVDGAGNVYVTGRFQTKADFDPATGPGDTAFLIPAGNYDVFFAKYDPDGNYIWAKSVGGAGVDYGYGIAVDAAGYVYLTGEFAGASPSAPGGADFNPATGAGDTAILRSAGANDIFLAKYSPDGNYIWAVKMGGDQATEAGYGIALKGGHVYITGAFQGKGDFNPGTGPADTATLTSWTGGGNDIFFAKFDTAGRYVWAKGIGSTGIDQGKGIAADAAGNVYVTGYFSTTSPATLRVDFNASPAPADTAYLASAGGQDIFLAKYDAAGNYVWAGRIGSPGSFDNDLANAIVVDALGNLYLTGSFVGPGTGTDFDPGPDSTRLISKGSSDLFILKMKQGCGALSAVTETACDSFRFNGVTYTASTVHSETFRVGGCDSIVTLNLTINHSITNPVVTGHYCDSVTFNGVTYTASGSYTRQYTSTTGCDSNIVYDITIGQNNIVPASVAACGSYEINGTTYTAAGIYVVTLTNTAGCDSTVVLDLTIGSPFQASATKTGTTLTAGSNGSYQWLNCEDNAVISGATGRSYTPGETGSYAVIITASGCSDTSGCIYVEGTGIRDNGPGNHAVSVYPNPADDLLYIRTGATMQHATIRLVNMTGQVLEEKTGQAGSHFSLDISGYAAGIYYVELNENGKTDRLKAVKK